MLIKAVRDSKLKDFNFSLLVMLCFGWSSRWSRAVLFAWRQYFGDSIESTKAWQDWYCSSTWDLWEFATWNSGMFCVIIFQNKLAF
jgi:hypothetical protein